MSNDVLVLAEHRDGKLLETSFELLGKARELADAWGGKAIALLLGAPDVAAELSVADLVVLSEHPLLADYNPEAYERALLEILRQRDPRLVLLSTTTAGLDLSGAVSLHWDAALVSYVVALSAEGEAAVATARIYGGKLLAELELPGPRSVCAAISGSFPASLGRAERTPEIEQVDLGHVLGDLRTTVTRVVAPEAGDVDITAAELLVSVGRGVASKDNIELIEELADALGASLAASRPVVDQGWLPKSRQVGKSGHTVKPKVYLMLGISGAPEHLEGMADAELVIACNTDPAAPVFDVAHYGTTLDLFDIADELTRAVKA